MKAWTFLIVGGLHNYYGLPIIAVLACLKDSSYLGL